MIVLTCCKKRGFVLLKIDRDCIIRAMSRVLKSASFYVFLLSFIYWGYLLYASEMTIQYDSINYEKNGPAPGPRPMDRIF